MDDTQIFGQIRALVDEEHQLERLSVQETSDSHAARIKEIEVSLDQCWDLLRQRQARRAAGLDPEGAHVRPGSVVEGYQQ